MGYTPSFTPQYENGWEDLPSETSPITAEALNAYDEAIENIEDYLASDESQANLADAYDETATYEAGDYRIHNGNLYKCLEDIDTPEEWDSTKWEICLITDEMGHGGGGTTVVANPVGEPTDDLETIQIGGTIYDIPGGGGGNANIWTGTKAEYEAQASQIEDDTVVLITDDEEHTQAFDVYSTDEEVIGTWLGETLYRKVYQYTGSSITCATNTWTKIPFITDVNTLKDGKIYDSNGTLFLGMWGKVDGEIAFYNLRSTAITIDSGSEVMVEYTKTS